MPTNLEPEAYEYPISLRFTDAALEMGNVSVPRLFLWFYPYLRGPQGENLDPREAFFLQYILAEKDGPESPTFHLSDLPCDFPNKTRNNYATKMRAMGLFYTRPHYKFDISRGVRQGLPPITHVAFVEWYFDPLFYSLSLVYQQWRTGRDAQRAQFGKRKIFYRLSDDYIQTVEIPPNFVAVVAKSRASKEDVRNTIKSHPDLTERLAALVERPAPKRGEDKGFYRVSPLWILRANEILAQQAAATVAAQPALLEIDDRSPSLPDLGSHGENVSPSFPNYGSHGAPSLPDLGGHGGIISPSLPDYGNVLDRTTTTISAIAKNFAKAIGVETYDPSEKEIRTIERLLRQGLSQDDILAGLARAIQYANEHGITIQSLAYGLNEAQKPRVRPSEPESQSEQTPVSAYGIPDPTSVMDPPSESDPAGLRDSHLDAMAQGDSDLLAVITLVQEYCNRLLNKSDVKAWTKLRDDGLTVDLAAKRKQTPIAVVHAAVMEAISAGSIKQDFFAANLARRIIETWSADSNGNGFPPQRLRNGNSRAGRPQIPSANALAEYERGLEEQYQRLQKKEDPK